MPLSPLFLILAAQSQFTVTNASYSGPVERPAEARLVWSDEFDGDRLDTAKWQYDTARNKEGWHNGELQYYSAGRAENIGVANGLLRIEARRETLDRAEISGLGRAELHLGSDLLEGRRLDLRLL